MILYDYYRSSACYRVRIALALKNIAYEKRTVHLIDNGGEQHHPQYKSLNPQELVPTLMTPDNQMITQSLAIIEYLDDVYPSPALLPKTALDRAHVRSLAMLVACDIHPVNNLRVLNQLRKEFNAEEPTVTGWIQHWIKLGFEALETRLSHTKREKPVSFGDSITLADICLIPQVYNAKRFHVPIEEYPVIQSIYDYCTSLAAFQNAAPD